MRCRAVEIELGGQTFAVPPLPAADWWPVLAEGNLNRIIGLVEDDDILDHLLDESFDGVEFEQELIRAVEQVSGRTLHEALVIVSVAASAWWWIGGRLARYGFRWDVMPLGAALDAVHGLLMENLTDEVKKKYEAALMPPVKKIDRAQAVNNFATFAGPIPTGGVKMPLSSDAQSGGTPTRSQPRQQSRPPRVRSAAPNSLPAPRARSGPAARNGPLPAEASPTS